MFFFFPKCSVSAFQPKVQEKAITCSLDISLLKHYFKIYDYKKAYLLVTKMSITSLKKIHVRKQKDFGILQTDMLTERRNTVKIKSQN